MNSKLLIFFVALFVLSCNKEEVSESETGITGQWFLTTINDVDVSGVECYNESYIQSDGESIRFYILDRNEDGSCETLVNSTSSLTIEDDFYYIDDEAIEIYIEGSTLTWRVDFETTLFFEK